MSYFWFCTHRIVCIRYSQKITESNSQVCQINSVCVCVCITTNVHQFCHSSSDLYISVIAANTTWRGVLPATVRVSQWVTSIKREGWKQWNCKCALDSTFSHLVWIHRAYSCNPFKERSPVSDNDNMYCVVSWFQRQYYNNKGCSTYIQTAVE